MNNVKIFARTIEDEAIRQINELAESEVGNNSKIRIMPDAHSGKGCTIGTTMTISDKVCPNLVGVDIGCGVNLSIYHFDITPQELDEIIKNKVPNGFGIKTKDMAINDGSYHHSKDIVTELKCYRELSYEVKERAYLSLGTLGGGNHFIEMYDNSSICVHTGSRNIGNEVARYYQKLAVEKNPQPNKELSYLTGDDMANYLHDVDLMQTWAKLNREYIIDAILGSDYNLFCDTVHNYIDIDEVILRKGAISAKNRETLVIPLNMRDGIMVCRGKGNDDWNNSAPHGAGRLYSRGAAKKAFKLEDYKNSMNGIFTTCVCEETIDEAPFAYKDMQEIIELVKPTVEIKEILKPIYNFKAK